jgi:archaellum component FlaG (FlaF/FlaG flagellin family)
VIAVASRNQLSTRELVNFEADPNFASSNYGGDEDFARALSIVIEPIAQNSWVTDTALFYVGSQPPTPTFGTIQVNSNPSGADVFVDGRFVGTTPVNYGARAGSREVLIELSGYETFSRVVNLGGGSTATISTDLLAIRRTGMVSFTSTPNGAEVFLNGRSIGTTPTGSVTLDEGSYDVRYVLLGYQETNVNFTVSGGQTQTVSTELSSLRGSLIVDTNVRGVRLFINGTSYGTLQTGRGSVDDLPAGTHQLTVVGDGFNTVVTDFIIRGGRTTELSIDLVTR